MSDGRPRRVAVIGTSGAGKTTISRLLADRLGLRHIELDAMFWLPNWQQPDRDEFRSRVITILDANPEWVADGNYSSAQDAILERADTVVWLDVGLFTCLWRVFSRALRRARTAEVMWGTNRETWRRVVGRDSLSWWVITTHRRRRLLTEESLRHPAYARLRVHRFRSTRAAAAWVASV
jgi:adenylate kinase family enzyme